MQLLSAGNLKAGCIGALLFVYVVLALSVSALHYTETLERVTVERIFDESIFGTTSGDSLVAIGLLLLFFSVTFRSNAVKFLSITVFGAAIGAFAVNSELLIIAGLMTIPVLVVLFGVRTISNRKDMGASSLLARVRVNSRKVATAFLAVIIVMEIGALARWIAYPFSNSQIYADISWKFAEIESGLFESLGLLSAFLVILLAFSFLYKWYILNLIRGITRLLGLGRTDNPTDTKQSEIEGHPDESNNSKIDKHNHTYGQLQSSFSSVETQAISKTLKSRNIHRGLLALALVVAPLLIIYPHLPGINPVGGGVSTDEQYYAGWMAQLRESSANANGKWEEILAGAFTINRGDRPVTLILLLVISNITGMPDLMVIRFLPVLLAPSLVAANYFLLRNTLDAVRHGIGKVKVYAAVGAILAAFSPQIVVGEYAGLLANWLAITVAYFAFYLTIKAWEFPDRKKMLVCFGTLFATLLVIMLIHLYTWAYLLVSISVFAALSYVFNRKLISDSKTKVILLVLLISGSFLVDYAKSSFFETPAVMDRNSLSSNLQMNDPGSRWDRLDYTLNTYVGGFLSVPALFLLALVWAAKSKLNGLNILMLSMIFILAVPISIGNAEFETRVLYNTPIHIVAALSFMWKGKQVGRRTENNMLRNLLIVCILLVMATYAMRAMANLPLELPYGFELDRQFLMS